MSWPVKAFTRSRLRPPSFSSLTTLSFRCTRPRPTVRAQVTKRFYAGAPNSASENINVEHASQIADSKMDDKFEEGGEKPSLKKDTQDVKMDEVDGSLRGKLLPTASHLFKLVLPLPESPFASSPSSSSSSRKSFPSSSTSYPPTIFLLHPSQPLSHISRLITASFPTSPSKGPPRVLFQSSFTPTKDRTKSFGLAQGGGRDDPIVTRKPNDNNGGLQWSDSTDIGDFVKEAALDTEFLIVLKPEISSSESPSDEPPKDSITIKVSVPSFASRTHYLRSRLSSLSTQISMMEELKKKCDREAQRGARRVALSGFGALVIYWGAVARLTFWDVGWDVMEPVTYLSGLTTVICGYLYFLYQGREVSYSSVLSSSLSARRQTLYVSRGFDIQRWTDLIDERRHLRREIQKIAGDYDVRWSEGDSVKEEEEDEEADEASKREEEEEEGKEDKKRKRKETEPEGGLLMMKDETK